MISEITLSLLLSCVGFKVVCHLIPKTKDVFIKRGLFGKDLSKKGTPIIPETVGIIPAVTYLFLMICHIPIVYKDMKLSSLLSNLICLQSMTLLGLLDDLFDIRWRHKFFMPAIASIPILIVYKIEYDMTHVLIPGIGVVDLGWFYYLYMSALTIFCPNSVNILAGVNGLEVGQTLVISILLILNDSYYIFGYSLGKMGENSYKIHIDSMCFILPFFGVALALFKFNKYPAKVFVGDTWCYFSGMVFAVVGISGHFAKTLMIFLIPQIINFIYSIPQLFGLVPCPRHRLPTFNENDQLMYNSWTVWGKEQIKNQKVVPLSKTLKAIFLLLEKIKLIALVRNDKGEIIKSSNLTLINLVIIWFGPMSEGKLCSTIMKIQLFVGIFMLVLRHSLAPLLVADNSWILYQ